MSDTGGRKYCVYVHVFPNGKRYYGISGREPEQRWCRNGRGYTHHSSSKIRNAVLKYGWNSITHIVLLVGLDREEAMVMERRLIADGKTTDPKFGYNTTYGGEGPTLWTPEMLAHMSECRKGRKLSDEHKAKIGAGGRGRRHTEETKLKMSIRLKGVPKSPEAVAKQRITMTGRRPTAESRAKMSAAHSLYRHTEESKAKIAASNRRRKLSAETRAKIGLSHQGKKRSAVASEKILKATLERFSDPAKRYAQLLTSPNARPVIQKDAITGAAIAQFLSAQEATKRMLGWPPEKRGKPDGSRIRVACQLATDHPEINKTAYGYAWEYAPKKEPTS